MPPVLFVHGWGGSFETTWRRPGITDLVADLGREVIGVDLLGHGDAPKPHDPASYADLTGRVADAIDAATPATGTPHQVDAVGFSLGALTLLRAAIGRPGRFRRLVLAGIGRNVFDRDDEQHRRIVEAVTAVAEGRDPGQHQVGRLFAGYARLPHNDAAALAAVLRRNAAPITPADLASVTCPTLVCVGEDDPVGPADALVDALPDATGVRLRRTDHFATPESFAFLDAMLEFVGGP